MSDASEADLQEQRQAVLDDDDAVPSPLEPEVPDADAAEQRLVVPDDEGYDI